MPKIWNGLDWISEPTYGVKNDTNFYSDCKLFSCEMLCLVFSNMQWQIISNMLTIYQEAKVLGKSQQI